MRTARLVAVAALLVGAGCTSEPSHTDQVEPAKDPSFTAVAEAQERLGIGERGHIRIGTHCGFEYTNIDGGLWRTRLRDDGHRNPPEGWPGVVEGTIERTSVARAVFVGTNVRVRATFLPAPDDWYMCA